MERRPDNMMRFLIRFSPYGMVPLAWFAYIGGASPLWGAAAGLSLTFLVGVSARIDRLVRSRPRQAPRI